MFPTLQKHNTTKKLISTDSYSTKNGGSDSDVRKNWPPFDVVQDDAEKYQVIENSRDDFFHSADIWNCKSMKSIIKNSWFENIVNMADWKNMISLTFEDEISPDVAGHLFKAFIRAVNSKVFGKNYRNFIKHSYFSYALASEYQIRDVLHFHVLTDRPLPFKFIHEWWGSRCGFVHTKIIDKEDIKKHVYYATKYVLKGGSIKPFLRSGELRIPRVLPYWWVDSKLRSRIEDNPLHLADPLQLAKSFTGRSK